MAKEYYVYILANKRNGTLYVGVTADLIKRVWEHKNKVVKGFTMKYGIDKLVCFETCIDPVTEIKREKRFKKYPRKWKLNLIEKMNPKWDDLYEVVITGLPGQAVQ
jgi:putative endonuclease